IVHRRRKGCLRRGNKTGSPYQIGILCAVGGYFTPEIDKPYGVCQHGLIPSLQGIMKMVGGPALWFVFFFGTFLELLGYRVGIFAIIQLFFKCFPNA
ncbi:MAG: hypothetical protein OEM80_10935, partial [Desulfobulbaceae bacterium]|nr:hypothetical protein [Desulfobulbaceae bacterium]